MRGALALLVLATASGCGRVGFEFWRGAECRGGEPCDTVDVSVQDAAVDAPLDAGAIEPPSEGDAATSTDQPPLQDASMQDAMTPGPDPGDTPTSAGQCTGEAPCQVVVGEVPDGPQQSMGGVSPRGLEGPHGCPQDQAVAGMYTEYDESDRLKGFRLLCVRLRFDSEQALVRWDGELTAGGENFGQRDTAYSQQLLCPADTLVVATRAYVGAWIEDPDNLQVMDRLELGCATLREGESGGVQTGTPTYVAQTLQGPLGLLDHNQVQRSAQCPSGFALVQVMTSGGGHTDHFDLYCAALDLMSDRP